MHPKDPHFINKMSGKRKYLGNSLPREVCHYLATFVTIALTRLFTLKKKKTFSFGTAPPDGHWLQVILEETLSVVGHSVPTLNFSAT